jgi:hypothetical protein
MININSLLGFVDQQQDFSFKFLPKSASTSVLQSLYYLAYGEVFNRNDHGYGVHRWGRLNSAPMVSVGTRLVVIRDPVKRLLSAYSNRVLYHRQLSQANILKARPKLMDPIHVFDPDISCFLDNLSLYMQVHAINHHCKPLSLHLQGVSLEFFTHVIKIEESPILEQLLSQIYQHDVQLPRAQTGGKKIPLRVLSYEQLSKIVSFYEEDYELLHGYYSKEMIFDDWEEDRKGL